MGGMAELWTSQQAADALSVHRSTVHRWVARGLLEPAQIIDAGGVQLYLFEPAYIGELVKLQRTG